MRKIRVSILVILALLVFTSQVFAMPGESKNFVAVLSGDAEIPARDTPARGVAIFHVSEDGTVLDYRLIAANISNVTASHIHCGTSTEVANVGLTLYVGSAASGRFNGVLAAGTKTAPDANNTCGWTSLQDVIDAMLSGAAYVNVHTNDGVAPPNTGPGDFPPGEIRGQIFEAGPTQ